MSEPTAPPPPVKVLHVLEAVRGGTSRHVADVVRHVPGVVHHVAVPPPGGARSNPGGARYDAPAVERMAHDGAVVHAVDMRRQPWHPVNALALPRLRSLTTEVGAHIVHGHSAVGGALARVAGRAAGVPVVYTANGIAAGAPYRMVERGLGRLTDRWIAVSPSEAQAASEAGLARPGRIVTIANGIDRAVPAPAFDVRSRLGLDRGTPLVGTVARLVAQKAPATFVRTAAMVAAGSARPHFLLIGMGPLQPEVDAEVARSGLGGRWHQLEHVEGAASVLGQLDVFVLASSFEGGPYTPLEAMRAGVPVVLSDVVGNRDVVDDGVTGFLRPPGDPPGLAEAVLRLLSDPPLRRAMTAAASARLAQDFDLDKMGRLLAGVYLSLVTPR